MYDAWDFVATLTSFLVLIWVPATVCISVLQHQEPSMKAEVEASRTLFVLDCAKSWAILCVPGAVLGQSKPWTSWNLASCADEIPWTNAIQSLGHKRLVWAPMRKGVKKKKCEQEELCSMQPALLQVLAPASSSLLQSCATSLHFTFPFHQLNVFWCRTCSQLGAAPLPRLRLPDVPLWIPLPFPAPFSFLSCPSNLSRAFLCFPSAFLVRVSWHWQNWKEGGRQREVLKIK